MEIDPALVEATRQRLQAAMRAAQDAAQRRLVDPLTFDESLNELLFPAEPPTPMAPEAAAILLYLNSKYPKLCTFDDIEGDKGFARDTINKHLKSLRKLKFVHRPAGRNKGVTLTEAGRSEAQLRLDQS